MHAIRKYLNGKTLVFTVSIIVMIVVTIVIYSNTLSNPFVFDDERMIVKNPHIRMTSLSLSRLFAGIQTYALNRPVAQISFALNYYIHRYHVSGYHVTNMIIHLVCGLLIVIIIMETLQFSVCFSQKQVYGISMTTALLWLVHPVQTQTVTYIVQRMNGLSVLFSLLSLFAYIQSRKKKRRGYSSVLLYCIGCIFWLLALFSKETAIVLPAIIFIYECFFIRGKEVILKQKDFLLICFLLIFLLICIWTIKGNPWQIIEQNYADRQFTLWERVTTEWRVLIYYISLILFPSPDRLNLDYHYPLSQGLLNPPTTALCLIALLMLYVLTLYAAKRDRLLSFAIFSFFIFLSVESTIIKLKLIYEHRLYFSSVFMILIMVRAGNRMIRNEYLKAAAVISIMVIFSSWTIERNSVWENAESL